MGTTGKYSCPANNADSTRHADYVMLRGIQCRPCMAESTVIDMDPVSNQVWIGLTWGPLMNDEGTLIDHHVTSYSVHIVDKTGRRLMTVASNVRKAPSNSSCCKPDLYSTSYAGMLPENYDKFMIVPNVGANEFLPMGFLTDAIVDNQQGLADVVNGSFTVDVSDPEAFKTNPAVAEALREAIADTITGVSREHVRILGITVTTTSSGSRRLRDTAGRRLAGSAKVDYQIILPSNYGGSPITATSINAETLKTNINTRITERNIAGVQVTGVKDFAVTTSSIGTPVSTGSAHRNARLGELAALLSMAAVLAMLGMHC